jgi:hypothetical protein
MRHGGLKVRGQFPSRRWALQSDPDQYDEVGQACLAKAVVVELAILAIFPILFLLAAIHRWK